MKINWDKPLTKGRQVYARLLDGRGGMFHVNYETGFLVGWDRWSDGGICFESRNIGL